jgi:hypothetical protein
MAKSSSAARGRSRSHSASSGGRRFTNTLKAEQISAQRAAAESKRRAVIGQRLDAAMHEHPSRFDAAPPRERIEIVLRLDDFMRVEQRADVGQIRRTVTNVFARHDDFLGRCQPGRGADEIERRPNRDVTRHPAENAAILLEHIRRRSIEDDHVTAAAAEDREVVGKGSKLARARLRLGNRDDVGAKAIGLG